MLLVSAFICVLSTDSPHVNGPDKGDDNVLDSISAMTKPSGAINVVRGEERAGLGRTSRRYEGMLEVNEW